MNENRTEPAELCSGCVYFPPNLPPQAYAQDDWAMLQARSCSFEHHPGDDACLTTRKTSCSVVDLAIMKRGMA
ncbi:hypothetical protein [Thiobacillus denitrificans]|uniref:hypothetical protein n=1 Tax=Thiobacillus denitrificans TaxID=36861 RepID=UPI00036E9239|nr:hypothetical protein [Thiobacillus denitrificans]